MCNPDIQSVPIIKDSTLNADVPTATVGGNFPCSYITLSVAYGLLLNSSVSMKHPVPDTRRGRLHLLSNAQFSFTTCK